jgi:hypothetical protein
MRASKIILAVCSLLLVIGALAHARAFRGASVALGNAKLPAIYRQDFKVLWLADSATLFTVAALFAAIAARPSAASRTVVMLIAVIPAATGVLIYIFVGNFYAGHLLLGTAAAAALAGFRLPAGMEPRL